MQSAREIAETVLFPFALDTDRADAVPRSHLDLLAEAGLYGLAGPPDLGGVDLQSFCSVVETLAGGCLSTAFVWIQHNTPVRTVAASKNGALREEWLAPLCSGRRRAGIALAALRAGPAEIEAARVEGGWVFDGDVPYVTGWGLIDVVLAAARTPDGRVVTALLDAEASQSLAVQRLTLMATNASSTVRMRLRRRFVPEERVVSVEPYRPPPAYDGGGRPNGSLALGVAGRCCRLLGPSPLDAELEARRRQLDEAAEETMADARAAAAELAQRAATALVVREGSRSLLPDGHAQRLAREAVFLQVFGSRPAIRAALLRRLGAAPPPT